jgi:hypothetical protein
MRRCEFKQFAWLLMAFVIGCGAETVKPNLEKVVPVSGTLTYKGQPLEGYMVSFLPVDGRRPAVGVTDVNGKFKLGTNSADDGAPPGQCEVTVVWAGPKETGPAGQESIIDDPAQLPKPKIQIPEKYASPKASGLSLNVPAGGLSDLKIDLQ